MDKLGLTNLSAKLNFTVRAVGNQSPIGGMVQFNKVKVLELMLFCGARDTKTLKNFIFDLKEYFQDTVT